MEHIAEHKRAEANYIRRIKRRREKWIKALESGKFKQARNALQTRVGYCCLGVAAVACKLSALERMHPSKSLSDSALSGSDLCYLGLSSEDQDSLIKKNDDARWTFDQIAAFVRTLPITKYKVA